MDAAGKTVNSNVGAFYRYVRVAVGFIILAGVLLTCDLRQFVVTISSVDLKWMLAMVSLTIVCRLLRAWKWNVLLRVVGIRISHWQALRLSLISHFAGAWTPAQLGGDAYRVFALRRFDRTSQVISTMVLERYAGLCAVAFFVVVTLPVTVPYLYQENPWILFVVLMCLGCVVAAAPVLFSRRAATFAPKIGTSLLRRETKKLRSVLVEFRDHRTTIGGFALVTLIEVFSYFVLNYFVARAVGLDVHLSFFLVAMPLVHLALRIPVSFQAIGVQEGCFAYAMLLHGFSAEAGLAVSVMQRSLEWLMSIIPGGLLFWLTSAAFSAEGSPHGDSQTIKSSA